MVYGEFRNLIWRTAFDKYCVIKHLTLLNPKFKEYHRGLASIVYNFFDKKTSGTHAWSENLATQNSGWQWLLI